MAKAMWCRGSNWMRRRHKRLMPHHVSKRLFAELAMRRALEGSLFDHQEAKHFCLIKFFNYWDQLRFFSTWYTMCLENSSTGCVLLLPAFVFSVADWRVTGSTPPGYRINFWVKDRQIGNVGLWVDERWLGRWTCTFIMFMDYHFVDVMIRWNYSRCCVQVINGEVYLLCSSYRMY